jgi:hypothetical protein
LYGIGKIVELLFLGLYTVRFFSDNSAFKQAVTVLSVSVLFQACLALVQYGKQGSVGGIMYLLGERTFTAGTPGIANASIHGELILRPYGTLPHPNVLAAFLVIGLSMVLHYLFFHSGKDRVVKLWILTILSIGSLALMLTLSRTMILLWFVIFVLHIAFYLFKRSNWIQKTAFLCGLISLIIIGSFFTPVGWRFRTLHFGDEAIVTRQRLASAAGTMIVKNPLLGVGSYHFIPSIPSVTTQSLPLQPVHNVVLLLLAEYGVIVTSLIGLLLYKLITRIRKIAHPYKILAITLLGVVFLGGMIDHYFFTLQQGQLLLAVLLGLLYSPLMSKSFGRKQVDIKHESILEKRKGKNTRKAGRKG